jgi:hypothetical protein
MAVLERRVTHKGLPITRTHVNRSIVLESSIRVGHIQNDRAQPISRKHKGDVGTVGYKQEQRRSSSHVGMHSC